MQNIRYAVAGAGNIFWTVHWKNLQKLSRSTCVAICDPAETAQKQAQQELPGVPVFATPEDLLTHNIAFDALINCSPPFAREQAVEVAITRGIPLFMEKPAAAGGKSGDAILQRLQASPIPTSVGFMFRYMPALDHLKSLLQGQKIIHIASEYWCPALTRWDLPEWFRQKEVSGGPIIDQAIHMVDLLRFIAGEISEVMAFEANPLQPKSDNCTVEESSSTLLRFAGGTTGIHLQSWIHDREAGRITVWTESDRITLHMDGRLEGYRGENTLSPNSDFLSPFGSLHKAELEIFFDAVRQNNFASVRSSFADALKSLKVAEAINHSMETNQPTKPD